LIIDRGTLVSVGTTEFQLDLEVPEKVAAIGPYAFRGVNGGKVLMPSTLEKIKDRAFDGARVTWVDFSRCENFTEIGDYAFSDGLIGTVLPDTVESIGKFGAVRLLLKKKNAIRFPKSLKYIGDNAFEVKKSDHVYAELTSFCSGSNMINSLFESVSSRFFGLEFTLHGMVDGVEVVELPIYSSGNELHKTLIKEGFFESSYGFDFDNYDRGIRHTPDKELRFDASVARCLKPRNLSEYHKKNFKDYISRNILQQITDRNFSFDQIKQFAIAGLLSKGNATKLLKVAQDADNAEAIAFYLELIKTQYGATAKSLKL
jgi:hypothetical protein